MKHQNLSWGVVLLVAAFLCLPFMVAAQNAPNPNYVGGTVTAPVVDGNWSEWDRSLTGADYFAPMYEAGDPLHTLMGRAYVRYDCSTQTVYVLVTKEAAYEFDPQQYGDNNWVYVAENNSGAKKVQASDGDNGTPPDFSWVAATGGAPTSATTAYEASFKLNEGYYYTEIKALMKTPGGQSGQTVSTGKASQADDRKALNIECAPVQLGDKVWWDKDEDGIQDVGEPGVEGITVKLYDSNGIQIGQPQITNAGGNYNFSAMGPGTYYVVFSGYSAPFTGFTTANAGSDESVDSDANASGQTNTVTLVEDNPLTGEAENIYLHLDGGLKTDYSSLGNFVWLDADKDGIQDAGESGVDGITVQLLNSGLSVIKTMTTANGGKYLFEELNAGTYYIQITPGSYSVTTKDASGSTDLNDSDVSTLTPYRTVAITLAANTDDLKWDMGLIYVQEYVILGDYVWIDADGDGVQDTNEGGVEGATVELLLDGVATGYSDVTDANGIYEIKLLVDSDAGHVNKYRLRFTLPNTGLRFTTANVGGDDARDSDVEGSTTHVGTTTTFSCNTAGSYLKWDAGVVAYSSIGNYVWLDTDADGIQETGENGIDGVTVQLLASDGSTVLATDVTSGGGQYLFNNLLSGTYFIKVTPGSYLVSPQNAGGNDALDSDVSPTTYTTAAINLPSNTNDTSQDIGLYVQQVQNVTLGDIVWLDADEDGVQDAGEAGLAGVTVELLLNGSPTSYSTTTNSNGSYELVVPVDAGNLNAYRLRFTLPNSGLRFSPQNAGGNDLLDSDVEGSTSDVGTTTTFSLNIAGSYLYWDAGVINLSSLGNFVWLDIDADGIQDGGSEVGIGGVTVQLLASDGSTVLASTTSSGAGLYSFNNLVPGTYYVKVNPGGSTVSPKDVGSNNATDSDVSITSPYRTDAITLAANTDDMSWDIGLNNSATSVVLGDRVWIDYDNDGIQDDGEPGVSGVTVRLRKDQGQDPIIGSATTDANGYWIISGITPDNSTHYLEFINPPTGYSFSSQQNQGGNDELDSDVNTSGIATPVPINAAGVYMKWDAAIVATYGSIGNFVWNDTDTDGIQESGETGIDGITVQLLASDGSTVLATDVTSGGGAYLFTNLVAGNYYIKVTPGTYTVSPMDAGGNDALDSDVNISTYKSALINLTAGENDLTQDIGLYYLQPNQVVNLGDYVWIDANENGVQDAGELGLQGVTVELLLNGATTGYSDVTDASGNWLITLPVDNNAGNVGDYTLRFTLPNTGLRFATANLGGNDATDSDVVGSTTHVGSTAGFSCNVAGSYLIWDAGVVNFSSIGNWVWLDAEATPDGVQDAGESGVDGITVQLLDNTLTLKATKVTANGGFYLFDNLTAGTYYIQVNPNGYAVSPQNAGGNDALDSDVSTSGNYRTAAITLDPDEADMTQDIGLYVDQTEKAIIGDYVWFDANENGVQDAGELPIAGVVVELTFNTNRIGTNGVWTTTDANGNWQIEYNVDNTYLDNRYGLVFYPPDSRPSDFDPDNTGWSSSAWMVAHQNYPLVGNDDNVDSDPGVSGSAIGKVMNPYGFNMSPAGVRLHFDCGLNIYDYGDAEDNPRPVDDNGDPYFEGTAYDAAQDGASHTIIPGFKMGANIDADPKDAWPNDYALGDDLETGDAQNGDDEDGITFTRTVTVTGRVYGVFVQGKAEVITVNATIPAGQKAYLDVWIDYNDTHGWVQNVIPLNVARYEEHVLGGYELQNGVNKVFLNISESITISAGSFIDRYMRVRFSSQGFLDPWAHAVDGEVEDYMVRIYSDRDGDGTPDGEEPGGNDIVYAPGGYIYNEVTGEIIVGGHITVTGPSGANIIIERDGSLGFYEFYVSTAGTYTLSYTPPDGYVMGVCTAQAGTLNPVPYNPTSPNPLVLGQNALSTINGRELPVPTAPATYCTNNTWYTTMYLEPGDQPVQLNNIPLKEEDPIAINLTSFAATEKDGKVEVAWTVESEVNNAGYNVYRSGEGSTGYIKVNAELIKSAGNVQNYSYSYLDTPPTAGQYWYKLEAVSLDGQSEFHGPVMMTLSTSVAEKMIPKEFALYQNYPNPFNPQTSIRFDLPKDSQVTLEIYDILGVLVTRLVDEKMNAGQHSVVWNAVNSYGHPVSTGIYMYRISAGDFVKTHKMVLMK